MKIGLCACTISENSEIINGDRFIVCQAVSVFNQQSLAQTTTKLCKGQKIFLHLYINLGQIKDILKTTSICFFIIDLSILYRTILTQQLSHIKSST